MTGARILLLVALAAALLLWVALSGGSDADLERGMALTDDAFAHVERELAALDGDYQALREQGLVLGLREQHDDLRVKLAALKSRRVALTTDGSIDRRQRLPQFQAIAEESDVLLALAVNLHRECSALVGFRRQLAPLLAEAGRQRGELATRAESDADRRARIAALASSLGELELRAGMVERLLRENVDQGALMGEDTLAKLRTLVAEQGRLLQP